MAYEIVVVGTSLGGLTALETILSGLPGSFPLPLVVVQHRSVESGAALNRILQRHSPLRVLEAQDKEPVLPGRVYLAPPDYHLLVDDGCLSLSTEGPVCYARPSIDVLFETAADACGPGVIGVVLTGASDDGAKGAVHIKRRGGRVVVQDPATAESPVMPRSAIAAAAVDRVLPLEEIAGYLSRLVGRERK